MKQLLSLLVLLLVCHVWVALADQTDADCGDQCQQVTYARPLQGALVLPKTSGNVRIVQPEELEQLSRHSYESSAPASSASVASSEQQQQAEQVSELSSSSCHPTVRSSTCCEVVDDQCCHPCSATSEQPTQSEGAQEAIAVLKEQENQLSVERETVEKEREEISEQRAALESSSSSSRSEQQTSSSSSSSSSSEQQQSSSSSSSSSSASSSEQQQSSSSSSAESSQAAESAMESAESAVSLHSQTEESLSHTIEKLTEEGQDERQRVEVISDRISNLEALIQELSTEETEHSNEAIAETANEISDKFKLLEVRLASMETRINIIEKGLLARAGAPSTIVAGGNVIQGGRGRGRKPRGSDQDVDVAITESLSSAIEGSSGESSSAAVSSIAEKLQQYSGESSSQVDSVVDKINQALEKLESSGSLTSSDATLLNEALSSNSLSSASSASASSSSSSSSSSASASEQQSSSNEPGDEISASFLEIGNPIRNLRDQINKHRTA